MYISSIFSSIPNQKGQAQAAQSKTTVDNLPLTSKDVFRRSASASIHFAGKQEDLIEAVGKGDISAIRRLAAAKKTDLNGRDKLGRVPLIVAVKNGNTDAINVLKDLGANLYAQDGSGFTPLTKAAAEGQSIAIRTLYELGANLNSEDGNGFTPLTKAAAEGQLSAIRTLWELGVDLNATDGNRFTPLTDAAVNGKADAIRLLKELGADINTADGNGHTPLTAAAANGKLDVIQLFYKLGADFHLKRVNGDSAFTTAEKRGNRLAAQLIQNLTKEKDNLNNELACAIKYGFKIAVKGDMAVVSYGPFPEKKCPVVTENGHRVVDVYGQKFPLDQGIATKQQDGTLIIDHSLERMNLLLSFGADIHSPDEYGHTPLQLAADSGNLEIVKELIKRGANVNQPEYGRTPLHIAASSGNLEIVKELIKSGANVNQPDENGFTPIFETRSVEIIEELSKHGADIHQKNSFGQTPIWAVAQQPVPPPIPCNGKYNPFHCDFNTAQILKELGGDINEPNDNGETALLRAASLNDANNIKDLVKLGAQVDQTNDEGLTPLYIAAAEGNTDTVKALIKLGADMSKAGEAGMTPIQAAAKNGHLKTIYALMEHNAHKRLSKPDQHSLTKRINEIDEQEKANGKLDKPIYMTVKDGDKTQVIKLAEWVSDVSGRHYLTDETPLHTAASYGDVNSIKELIKIGANVNAQTRFGPSPLDLAAAGGHTEAVKALIELGATIEYSRYDGEVTAISCAAQNGHNETVEVLKKLIKENKVRKAGIGIDCVDYPPPGSTPTFPSESHKPKPVKPLPDIKEDEPLQPTPSKDEKDLGNDSEAKTDKTEPDKKKNFIPGEFPEEEIDQPSVTPVPDNQKKDEHREGADSSDSQGLLDKLGLNFLKWPGKPSTKRSHDMSKVTPMPAIKEDEPSKFESREERWMNSLPDQVHDPENIEKPSSRPPSVISDISSVGMESINERLRKKKLDSVDKDSIKSDTSSITSSQDGSYIQKPVVPVVDESLHDKADSVISTDSDGKNSYIQKPIVPTVDEPLKPTVPDSGKADSIHSSHSLNSTIASTLTSLSSGSEITLRGKNTAETLFNVLHDLRPFLTDEEAGKLVPHLDKKVAKHVSILLKQNPLPNLSKKDYQRLILQHQQSSLDNSEQLDPDGKLHDFWGKVYQYFSKP